MTRRARTAAAAASLGLLLGSLAACGDPQEEYCSQLRQDQAALGEIIGSTTPGALLTGLPTLRQLGAKAPEDLTDEWQTFLNAVEGLSEAVRRAGLRPSEVRGTLPQGLGADDRSAITGAAVEASTSAAPVMAVTDAADGIETQARDVCKVNLGL